MKELLTADAPSPFLTKGVLIVPQSPERFLTGEKRIATLVIISIVSAFTLHMYASRLFSANELNTIIIQKPTTLIIPAINLHAAIEPKGRTLTGEMDTPNSAKNVAWYRDGVKPGETGNAVIAGHFDTTFFRPAVFWDLQKLKPGDEVAVEDAQGTIRHFVVERTETYEHNSAPLQEIFGATEDKRLNLITCAGAWSWLRDSYDKRVVVYTKSMEP